MGESTLLVLPMNGGVLPVMSVATCHSIGMCCCRLLSGILSGGGREREVWLRARALGATITVVLLSRIENPALVGVMLAKKIQLKKQCC
jgi:hypothetical protein